MSNSPSLRLFEDKFDYFSCLLKIIQRADKLDPHKKILCFVEDDFFQKVGYDVAVPRVEFITCDATFDPTTIVRTDDVLYVIYAIQHASIGLPIAKYLIANNIHFVSPDEHGVGGFVYDDKVARDVIEHAYFQQSLDRYDKFDDPGAKEDFVNLCQALFYTNHLPGVVVEVGCYRGSSGSVMLDYANEKKLTPKTFYFFDVFSGFLYPEALKSADINWALSHVTEGVEIIAARLKSKAFANTVHVEAMNIITDEIPPAITQISMCTIDVDLYEAVHAALFRLAPLMVTGGIMICEDAGHTPGLIGARVALDEFIHSEQGKNFTVVFQPSGQVFLVKHQ